MPFGLKFQRKHRIIGYKIKYFYYLFKRRDVLQKKMSFGENEPQKTYYIVKPDYQDGVEGLLSLLLRQMTYVDYADKKGYIPYVDWKKYRTQYYNGIDNVWEFFFEQPSEVGEKEVYSGKNVIISGWTFKDINKKRLFDIDAFYDAKIMQASKRVLDKHLRFTEKVNDIVDKEKRNLNIENCIGVYIRGTDYVKMKPSGEYIQPSAEQVINMVDVFINKHNCRDIYLVTEDGEIYDVFLKKYNNNLKIVSFDNFIRNYDGNNVLSKSNVLNVDRRIRGQDYLVKMILLSKCKYYVGSITQGSKFSYILNGGNYEDEYVFDLGLY